MSEETQTPYQVIDRFIAQDIVTYTNTAVIIKHKVRVWVFVLMVAFVSVSPFLLSGAFWFSGRYYPVFWIVILWIAIAFLLIILRERSYRYIFDKENQEIRCKWVGFQGIHTHKRKDLIYPLDAVKYISVELLGPRQPRFKLKAVLKNDQKIDLPSGASMRECLEDANKYRDFLEISAPLELPG